MIMEKYFIVIHINIILKQNDNNSNNIINNKLIGELNENNVKIY